MWPFDYFKKRAKKEEQERQRKFEQERIARERERRLEESRRKERERQERQKAERERLNPCSHSRSNLIATSVMKTAIPLRACRSACVPSVS